MSAAPASPLSATTSVTRIERLGARALNLMSGTRDTHAAANLRWFRTFLLIHFAIRSFLTIPDPAAGAAGWLLGGSALSPVPLGYEVLLWVSVIVGIAGQWPRYAIWTCRAAAACVLVQMMVPHTPTGFPLTANHLWLEFLTLCVFSFLDERRPGEDAMLLATVRWMVAIMFFYSGLQKVLYGTYFDGQFLAAQIASDDRFASAFRFLISAEEFERLRALSFTTEGDGPFRVASPVFIAMSNAVYLAEMLIPILLLFARTRTWAALAGIGMVILIQFGAREITFGVFMVNLFLLFLPGPWNKRLLPISVVLYMPLLAQHVGLIESGYFEFAPA